ncbi:MAG: hypothetical protein LBH34_03180 [Prevotellaceae bacterium]|jgi:hypothetical protein|nr:hypothetical protein [Prevotellaceae bacterium]
MIFRYKLSISESKDFEREYDIQGEASLYDLHVHIQQDLDYDESQHVLIYTADNDWNPLKEYSLFGQGGSELIDEVTLGSLVRVQVYRLLYMFDTINERSFRLELLNMEEPKHQVRYPQTTLNKGEPPIQIGDSKSSFSSIFDQAMPDFDANMYASPSHGGDD